jgi:hypothetical protein
MLLRMTTESITNTDFHLDVPVAAPAQRLREAVARVGDWWSTALDRDGDEFTAYFEHNWTRVRVDGDRWTITAQDTPALPVADEWVGNVLTFRVEETGAETSTLHFTHYGLLAQECASDCTPAWQNFIASLVSLAETGEGRPWRPGLAARGEGPSSALDRQPPR